MIVQKRRQGVQNITRPASRGHFPCLDQVNWISMAQTTELIGYKNNLDDLKLSFVLNKATPRVPGRFWFVLQNKVLRVKRNAVA